MRKLSMYIVINVQAGESEKNYIEEIEELKRIIQTKNILIQRELTNKTMMFEQINSIVNENNKLKKILKANFNEVNINAIYDKQDLKGKVIDEEEETNENDNIIEIIHLCAVDIDDISSCINPDPIHGILNSFSLIMKGCNVNSPSNA